MPMFSTVPNARAVGNQPGRNGAGDRNVPGPSVMSRVSTHSTRLGELEKIVKRLETNMEGVERIPETDSDSDVGNGN